MKKFSLTALGRDYLDRGKNEDSGRSATTVFGGHDQVLRQTVIALRKGHSLNSHSSLDEATVYVLSGRVRLTGNGNQWIGWVGDLLVVPEVFHGLDALEDSAVLLTVAKTGS
jgi:quercetin dioxygenase-like cupin family protein